MLGRQLLGNQTIAKEQFSQGPGDSRSKSETYKSFKLLKIQSLVPGNNEKSSQQLTIVNWERFCFLFSVRLIFANSWSRSCFGHNRWPVHSNLGNCNFSNRSRSRSISLPVTFFLIAENLWISNWDLCCKVQVQKILFNWSLGLFTKALSLKV